MPLQVFCGFLRRDYWSLGALLTMSFVLRLPTPLDCQNLSICPKLIHLTFCLLKVVLEKNRKKKLNKLNFLTVWHVTSLRFQDYEHVLI